MAQFYEMPSISPTMEMGTVVEWRVQEGAAFDSGTVLAEIGTDKANMEAEIFDEGVLIKHLAAEGDEAPPGFPIAIWGASATEDITGLLAEYQARKANQGGAPAQEAPKAEPTPEAPKPAPAVVTGTVERTWMGRSIRVNFYDPPGDVRFAAASPKVKASPLARKVAKDLGLDLHRIQGTGPSGRIVRADVESAPRHAAGPAAPASVTKRNSPMRKTIAKRLLASHQEIPTFFLTVTYDMRGFLELRAEVKAKRPEAKISYNDMFVLAVARALRAHPEVNASWSEDSIVRHGQVDIGVAVAVPDGLITPVVRGADQLGLSTIGAQIRELAGRAREQKLDPSEYTGATLTISNLGMMGIEHFTAIINPPEAAILAVGAITEEPVVEDGALTIAHRMKVTMTCDHRVIDGAVGAGFLKTLRDFVESPTLLLV